MSQLLKIENAFGLVATTNSQRASKSGLEYEGMLPAPNWTNSVVKRNGTVGDTVNEMKKLIFRTTWQTKELSKKLKGHNLYNTCQNIWEFLFYHFNYKEDDKGEEQLREPALSWYIRTRRGIDCDDFSIMASTILYNLHIPHYLRIARYRGKDYFQHVYVVVPINKNRYITIDGVLNEYDTEKEPAEIKDYLIMNNNNLNGIDISVLGGIGDEPDNEISGIINGIDFEAIENMGAITTEAEELGAICRHLQRTRQAISRYPHIIREIEHPQDFLRKIDYALRYWNTPQREQALDILCGEEDRQNAIMGLDGISEDEELNLYFGANNISGVELLGKIKAPKRFFNKIKQAVKKTGQGIKKAVKAVVRFNPVTTAARAGLLLAMKLNTGGLASKIKYAYLSESEARQKGLDMGEWNKLKKTHGDIEHMFVNVLQGKKENLRSAILSGKAGGLAGTTDLGVVVAAGAATTTAAATPFIVKIVNWLKGINFKKLTGGIKKGVQLIKNRKGKTANEGSEAESGNENSEASAAEQNSGEQSNSGETQSSENNTGEKLPGIRTGKEGEQSEPVKEGFFDKIKTWVKANPVPAVLIGAGTAGLLYYAFKPKNKTALSGTKKVGKKKNGRAKTHAPALPMKTKTKKTRKRKKSRKKNKTPHFISGAKQIGAGKIKKFKL